MGGLMDDRASSVAKDVKEPGQGEIPLRSL
jgi:hypothetical protein